VQTQFAAGKKYVHAVTNKRKRASETSNVFNGNSFTYYEGGDDNDNDGSHYLA
jgi:hypothetical protein